MDKKRLKMSDPTIITDYFNKIRVLQEKYSILPGNTYNVDEKGFRQGISDCAKVIVRWRERGITAKIATDGKRELITVIECISGDRQVLPPMIISKGAGHYMGWYQHLDLEVVGDYKFVYPTLVRHGVGQSLNPCHVLSKLRQEPGEKRPAQPVSPPTPGPLLAPRNTSDIHR